MSTITLMRIYLRYHNMPRLPLPCIGYAGTLYSSPLIDRQRSFLIGEYGRTNGSPELVGSSGILVKKGAMGSYHFRRSYSTSTTDIKKAEKERENPSKFKKRTAETVKIMVISETGALSAMTLEEAGKLAKKKNLTLVHITNPKEKPVSSHGKEIYKLVGRLAGVVGEEEDDQEVGQEETGAGGKNSKPKEVKTVLLKSNTGQHDIQSKVNSMKKWIEKGHRIRVVISQSGDKGSSETVFKAIEQGMSEVEGQVQQKIVKGTELRFYVGPPKKIIKSTVKTPAHPHHKKGKEEVSDLSEDDEDDDDDDSTIKRKAATRK